MVTSLEEFKKIIWDYYWSHARMFEWRHVEDPYKVFISEVMLQQTQTHRVIPKFNHFISTFGSFHALADASLQQVLAAWQGLGYNRRGLYLQRAAQEIVGRHGGKLPDEPSVLQELPGIGKATAASICAFAFNKPTVFIETNIRAVFIYFFFPDKEKVDDKDLMPLVAEMVDPANAREWYYALMDYGVMLKKTGVNPCRKSKHHTKQSKFEGSDRQIRGQIIQVLTQTPSVSFEELLVGLQKDHERVHKILMQLKQEAFIEFDGKDVAFPDTSYKKRT